MNLELIKEEIDFLKNILLELDRNPDVFVSIRIDVDRRIKELLDALEEKQEK